MLTVSDVELILDDLWAKPFWNYAEHRHDGMCRTDVGQHCLRTRLALHLGAAYIYDLHGRVHIDTGSNGQPVASRCLISN